MIGMFAEAMLAFHVLAWRPSQTAMLLENLQGFMHAP